MGDLPFHKTALLGLLASHPERAVPTLLKLIHDLPDSLDYSDLSSTNVAEELLLSLTKPNTVPNPVEWQQPGVLNCAAHPTPRGLHHLSEDHNGEPICNCGWNPTAHYPRGEVTTRETARNYIRSHITTEKEKALGDRRS